MLLKKLKIVDFSKIDIIQTTKSSLIDELTNINENADSKKIGMNRPKINDKIGLFVASLSLNTENNQKIGIIEAEKPRTKSLLFPKNPVISFQFQDNNRTFIWRFITKNIRNQKISHR